MAFLLSGGDVKRIGRAVRKIERMPRPEEFLREPPRQIVPNAYVRVIGEGSGGGGIPDGEEGLATLLRRASGAWEETVWQWRIINETGRTLEEDEDVIADWESQSGRYVVWSDATSAANNTTTTALPCYAVRNNTLQLLSAGTATVTLDTQIHRYPDDATIFELSSSVVTIKQSGIYRFSFVVPLQPVSAAGDGGAWLEEGSTFIKGANSYFNWPANTTEITATFTNSIDHKVDVSGGNQTYRLRVVSSVSNYGVDASDITAGGGAGGYARLDICKVRDI